MATRAGAAGVTLLTECHAAYLHPVASAWAVRHLPAAEIKPGQTTPTGGSVTDPRDAVLLAIPSDQAVALLETAAHPFTALAANAVIAPCWAVMARFPAPVPGADILQPSAGPIAWAARENARPGHPAAPDSWTIHATPGFSRTHLEDPGLDVARHLMTAFRDLTGATAPDLLLAHRWRHALVEVPVGRPCLWDEDTRIGVCGDWCLGGRIEAAYDSGLSLARAVISTR